MQLDRVSESSMLGTLSQHVLAMAFMFSEVRLCHNTCLNESITIPLFQNRVSGGLSCHRSEPAASPTFLFVSEPLLSGWKMSLSQPLTLSPPNRPSRWPPDLAPCQLHKHRDSTRGGMAACCGPWGSSRPVKLYMLNVRVC